RNAGSGSRDPGHHPLHAAGELSRPAELGGAGGAIEIGTADRDAAHWPPVRRRNVDFARPCISSCERSSPPAASASMTAPKASTRAERAREFKWEEATCCAS